MKEKIQTIIVKKKMLLIVFIIASIMFAIPSLRYMLQNGTVLHFNEYFKFCLNDDDRVEQAIFYIAILALLTIVYVFIIKNREKLFKNIKEICIYIAIISLIFVMVLPFLSSDIFYYLGVGRLDSKYGQNPYYVTIKDFVENEDNMQYLEQDTVLAKGYENDWGNTTVVYGPVWTLICKIISGITFGNIDVALFVFKLFNMLIHVLNCYVIYKLTGKKIFVLLYGLNPYMFIEGIANVNDLLNLAKKYNVTLTVFLTSVLIKSIGETMNIKSRKRPIVIVVPVNLRKYYPTYTVRNFFSAVNISYKYNGEDIEDIIKVVNEEFKKNLDEDNIKNKMNNMAILEDIFILRLIPIFIKDLILRYVYKLTDYEKTIALSNIGVINMPGVYEDYIDYFDVFISTSTIQLCMCSFKNKILLSFTSQFINSEIEKNFFRYLTKEGINIIINTNKIGGNK